MAAAVRAYRFEVSNYFFRLTTESVRLFSNSVGKHSSLDEVVEERASRAGSLLESYETDDLKAHLRVIPTEGDIRLTLTVPEASAELIDAAALDLERVLGTSVRFAEAMSLMLFDFVVERNATEVMTKLGITSAQAKGYRPRLKKRASNIASIA